jgi:GAF domain-containing protein
VSPDRDDRRRVVLERLLGDDQGLSTKQLCAVCVDVTGVTGAGIMLMAGDVARGSVCSSDDVSGLIERVQYELGEGPCVDAYRHDRPVLEPDLAHPVDPRWLGFAGPVLDAGARAVFGFPVRVGAVRLGSLNLYNDRPGALTDEQEANALVMADVAGQAVLLLQADAHGESLAVELATNATFHYVVHQASGMVAAQLEVSVADALERLRAHAFGNDCVLADVARDVVARRLRFDPGDRG